MIRGIFDDFRKDNLPPPDRDERLERLIEERRKEREIRFDTEDAFKTLLTLVKIDPIDKNIKSCVRAETRKLLAFLGRETDYQGGAVSFPCFGFVSKYDYSSNYWLIAMMERRNYKSFNHYLAETSEEENIWSLTNVFIRKCNQEGLLFKIYSKEFPTQRDFLKGVYDGVITPQMINDRAFIFNKPLKYY